ncbi:MAG TPA: WXG100 family type VII secretion target [Ruania sp.]|uniref:WXG100 family type VII secretion target n=1 Tax=Ruania albidiflava TaxID=366586 RepID=UPI0023F37CCB|nr:WXG100 family type VII secretion target [Ruania albidiflava]HLS65252.1 WXG100 family type VII secretion target [Ruania sp.]
MTDFGATYDEMESCAGKLDDGKESIDDALTECQGYVDELVEDGFKTEKASGKFKDGYDDLTSGLKDASEGVSEMAQALRDMAQAIRDLDDQLAG